MKKIYIVGAGGFVREVLWLIKRINEVAVKNGRECEWYIAGFIDDDRSLHGEMLDDYPVLGGGDYLAALSEDVYVVIAIGSAKVKKIVVEKLSALKNIHFATLIDPSVILSDRVQIGDGCIICAGTIMTVDITIGSHVIINLDCTLGHDDVIGDYVTIYPSVNVSGNVKIGEESEIGTGAQIIQGKSIGKQVILGAGAVVVKDIKEAGTYVGLPASRVGKRI